MTENEIRAALHDRPLHRNQILAIAICVALNALDGFDVLSISFASPGIAAEWRVDRAMLGIILSMELFGMAIGAIVLGKVADRLGRRPVAIACLIVLGLGMAAAPQTGSVSELSFVRLITGLGIGGMLATTNAIVAEYSNNRTRATAVALMAAGYPLGAVVGGAISSYLLDFAGWRSVFYVGAVGAVALLPLLIRVIPESPFYFLDRNDPAKLPQLNRSLTRLGFADLSDWPVMAKADRVAESGILSAKLRGVTILLTTVYFLHIMTFYFVLKWIPKIVVDMGYPASSAGGVLVMANVGGMLGGIAFSLAALKIPINRMLAPAMALGAIGVVIFGRLEGSLQNLIIVAAVTGFFTNAAVVGIYGLVAKTYPDHLRAGGTGFVIGLGRGGAALAPVIAGLLFSLGGQLNSVAILMACGSIGGAAILLTFGGRLYKGETPRLPVEGRK